MIIDCKSLAAEIKQHIKTIVEDEYLSLTLTIVKVGDDPASESYVRGKVKDCEEVGIRAEVIKLPENTEEATLLKVVKLAQYSSDGIIVQLPLPKHINKDKVINAIRPDKDVDGFRRDSYFTPCTPAGIMRMLPKDLAGKDCLVINRSDIVGRPLVNLLLDRNATVTVAHSKTKDLETKIENADVIITGVGIPNFIKLGKVKSHQVVIDVSINRGKDGKLCGDLEKPQGDVDFTYSSVPGGVGLMTRAMLLYNVLKSHYIVTDTIFTSSNDIKRAEEHMKGV